MSCLTERVAAAKVVPVIESGSLVRWILINRMDCCLVLFWTRFAYLCSDCRVQEYAQIYRHKPFPTAIIDTQYNILECNDRFLSMVNNFKDQVLNHSLTAALSENPPELEQLFS